LLYHHELVLRREGDDVHPIDAFEHKKVVLLLRARGNKSIRAQFKDAEITQLFAASFFPGTAHLSGRKRRWETENSKGNFPAA
jgi:hypothetical protein